ncbi:MAG: type II secretion system protein [Verrucomicrobia bacterium]|nr:type II secretion system protein [Verrucomicrobiota bacterium]
MIFEPIKRQTKTVGFTFVEAIFTIAVIGIMSSLALTAISNGSRDANRIVARQQQAVIQEALNSWVMSQSRVGSTAQVRSLANIQASYNALTTTEARFNLLVPNPSSPDPNQKEGYLDQTTADHFFAYKETSERLHSAALKGAKQYLVLSNWASGSFPMVEMVAQP